MADKFVPLEKMSKKNRREFYSKQRKSWNGQNPVTRTAVNPKSTSGQDKRRSFCGQSFDIEIIQQM